MSPEWLFVGLRMATTQAEESTERKKALPYHHSSLTALNYGSAFFSLVSTMLCLNNNWVCIEKNKSSLIRKNIAKKNILRIFGEIVSIDFLFKTRNLILKFLKFFSGHNAVCEKSVLRKHIEKSFETEKLLDLCTYIARWRNVGSHKRQ
jgi:hypothetical protein